MNAKPISPLSDDSSPANAMLATDDLRERGWTTTQINRFLGEPDAKRLPRNRRGGRPANLYAMTRVVRAESEPALQIAVAEAQQRSLNAREGLTRKRRILENCVAMATADINSPVVQLSLEEIARTAGSSIRIRSTLKSLLDSLPDPLGHFSWHPGIRDARRNLRTQRLQRIASDHPQLQAVCRSLISEALNDQQA